MTDAKAQFLESARRHGKGTLEGNAAATNAAYKDLKASAVQLRRAADRGEAFLLGGLADGDPSVVIWSALYLLPLREAEALAALKRVRQSGPPLMALEAEMTLKEWDAGRLKID